MTHAQQLHRLGIHDAVPQAPQRPRGLRAVAVVEVGSIPARFVLREAHKRNVAHRELRAFQPTPQAPAAAAVQWAQQVGRPVTTGD